jgi:hypothetical protein
LAVLITGGGYGTGARDQDAHARIPANLIIYELRAATHPWCSDASTFISPCRFAVRRKCTEFTLGETAVTGSHSNLPQRRLEAHVIDRWHLDKLSRCREPARM